MLGRLGGFQHRVIMALWHYGIMASWHHGITSHSTRSDRCDAALSICRGIQQVSPR